MLRAKQIGTLSQCARTFFLNGSRCSAADGSSCTCTEDENCVSKKQQRSNEVLQTQKTVGQDGSLPSGDAVVGHHRAESGVLPVPVPVPHILPSPTSSARSDDSIYVSGSGNVHAAQKDLVHTSTLVTDHFVKAGFAAVNFLSDLANYKIPTSDGSGAVLSSQNCMIDSTRPISNVRSSNGKPHKIDYSKSHGKPSVDMTREPNSATHYNGSKGKCVKSGTVKGVDKAPSTAVGNSVETQNLPSDCGRRSIPLRHKTDDAYHLIPNSNSKGRTSEDKVLGGIAEGFKSIDKVQKPLRYTKKPTGSTSMTRQSVKTGPAMEHAYQILQQMRWGPAAEQALGNLGCSFNAYQANQILKQLQDHSVALSFFCWLKRQPGFKHDEYSYTTMVGILGRSRQFNAINNLLDEMVRDGCHPNVVTYNRLIHSYGRANYMDEAIGVLYQMQEAGCEPDRVTYCTLIDIHAKAGFLDVALDMYRRMQEVGLSPDTFTYSVIINCLGKAGHLAASYKLFCEMISHGCVPNLVTYNIMIALQAKARNYPSALQLYRDMQTAGFRPDKVTYSIVMEVLGHCGYLDEAEAVFAEMKQNNWIPDEPVYGLLVDLWGKAGNVDKARGWYLAMLNDGLHPNVPTCNSLLSAFLRVHRFADAYTMLQSMMRSGPDGQNVREHASNFLELVHSEDRESKRGLVDAVIDFLHKSGLKEEAGSVWEVAAQKNVYPDAIREKRSCYWLINLHVMSDGTAITALSRTLAWFRRQMLASGVGPNRIDIVTGWGRRSRVTGSSLVRQSVEELLHIFQFPFFTESGNSGCFVGCGEPLNRWLLHSYVERMHLL
ncbi:pentatricopeptide repeat-containing protein At1g18900-like isoform X2 [Macadamia integrifolia]|uniref:pentatricopeptide repeat-containing protein At1g18900-like isoform X2 n=1 Tax=Macadamia integrifolia TaxID=60698 RepID=UPI001C4F3F98|nr:pentatricopeptide repeat-containing protein At1g18900-like isoform X2 [Macadamia integrifolia]